MSRSKRTGSAQKAGSGSRHISGKSPNTPTRKGDEKAARQAIRALAPLPADVVVVPVATLAAAQDALEYVQRYGMEDDGSSHSIDAQVGAAVEALRALRKK